MDKTYQTVVQGEASESEEEDEKELHTESSQSIVVEGEASESESDEQEIDTSISQGNDIPPIKLSESPHSSVGSVEDMGSPSSSPKHVGRPKYDSILNKKLWESNLSMCNNLNGLVSQTYLSAAKEISNYSQHLTKSHTAIQDVSHHMRLMTNDLFNLDDRIDIIATCKLLPDIKFPAKGETTPVSLQPGQE